MIKIEFDEEQLKLIFLALHIASETMTERPGSEDSATDADLALASKFDKLADFMKEKA